MKYYSWFFRSERPLVEPPINNCCSAKNCFEEPTVTCSMRYKSKTMKRASTRTYHYCEKHAKQWEEKHHLRME